MLRKEEKIVNKTPVDSRIENAKIELIKLRIKNGYYNREDVYKLVIDEIMRNRFKKK